MLIFFCDCYINVHSINFMSQPILIMSNNVIVACIAAVIPTLIVNPATSSCQSRSLQQVVATITLPQPMKWNSRFGPKTQTSPSNSHTTFCPVPVVEAKRNPSGHTLCKTTLLGQGIAARWGYARLLSLDNPCKKESVIHWLFYSMIWLPIDCTTK